MPRVSGIPDEDGADAGAVFVATRHASLQNAAAALPHVAGVLTTQQIDLRRFRARVVPPVKLALDVEDVYWAHERVVLRVRASPPPSPALSGTVVRLGDDRRAATLRLAAGYDDWCRIEIPPLAPGVYRVTLGARPGADDVSDLFESRASDQPALTALPSLDLRIAAHRE